MCASVGAAALSKKRASPWTPAWRGQGTAGLATAGCCVWQCHNHTLLVRAHVSSSRQILLSMLTVRLSGQRFSHCISMSKSPRRPKLMLRLSEPSKLYDKYVSRSMWRLSHPEHLNACTLFAAAAAAVRSPSLPLVLRENQSCPPEPTRYCGGESGAALRHSSRGGGGARSFACCRASAAPRPALRSRHSARATAADHAASPAAPASAGSGSRVQTAADSGPAGSCDPGNQW